MALEISPSDTLSAIKTTIRHRIGAPDARFQLTYSGYVLATPDTTIEHYNIPHEATLYCISLRPGKLRFPINEIRVRDTKYGLDSLYRLKMDVSVTHLKSLFATEHRLDPEFLSVGFEGRELVNGETLYENGIYDGATLFVSLKRA